MISLQKDTYELLKILDVNNSLNRNFKNVSLAQTDTALPYTA